MATEAYKKNGIVAVVHRRKHGKVYGHTQREDEEFIEWTYLFQRGERDFARDVEAAEAYDVRQLPALGDSSSEREEG